MSLPQPEGHSVLPQNHIVTCSSRAHKRIGCHGCQTSSAICLSLRQGDPRGPTDAGTGQDRAEQGEVRVGTEFKSTFKMVVVLT